MLPGLQLDSGGQLATFAGAPEAGAALPAGVSSNFIQPANSKVVSANIPLSQICKREWLAPGPFLTPLAVLLPFQITEAACVACLAGAGDTRTGLKVLGGVAVLNVPLAWGLGFGVGPVPALGFVGISLGTGLSHLVGCVVL